MLKTIYIQKYIISYKKKGENVMDWQEIWQKKGNISSNDLKLLDGFEETTINPKIVAF